MQVAGDSIFIADEDYSISKGDFDRAIKDYNKAIQLDPNHITAHNNLNIALRNRKKRDQN